MSPIAHALIGWLAIQPCGLELRERRWITFVGLAPDLDGLGLAMDLCTAGSAAPTHWFAEYHHVLTHNFLAGVAFSLLTWACCGRRWRTLALSLVVFHLHLICDVVGSGGPDGAPWTLAYCWPFSDAAFAWSGQWALDAWPNLVIAAVALLATGWMGVRHGRTAMELLSPRLDAGLVGILRRWAGRAAP